MVHNVIAVHLKSLVQQWWVMGLCMKAAVTRLTLRRCTGSWHLEACFSSSAYSIYSTIRWRKLNGSLNTTGIVILDSSFTAASWHHSFLAVILVAAVHTVQLTNILPITTHIMINVHNFPKNQWGSPTDIWLKKTGWQVFAWQARPHTASTKPLGVLVTQHLGHWIFNQSSLGFAAQPGLYLHLTRVSCHGHSNRLATGVSL